MTATETFRLSEQSQILTPEATGLITLLEGLGKGRSIYVSQSDAIIVRAVDETPQRLYCETSGTIGAPKVIRRMPRSWTASFEQTAQRFDAGAADCYAVLGHLGHSLALYATLEALHVGADLCVLAGQSPGAQLSALWDYRVSILYATPSQLQLLCRVPENDLDTAVRLVFCGGGKLRPELRRAVEQRFPKAGVIEFYGTSETSFITMSDSDTPVGSVGKCYPGVDLQISGEFGEVQVQSPYMFDGYGSASSAYSAPIDTPFGTGEIGYVDEQGYLFLKGRKDRMVNVADQVVFPEEIEDVLSDFDAVTCSAVVPMEDEARGQKLVAFVETAQRGDFQTDLRKACAKALHARAIPSRFVLVDHIPKLPAGKPDYHALSDMAKDL